MDASSPSHDVPALEAAVFPNEHEIYWPVWPELYEDDATRALNAPLITMNSQRTITPFQRYTLSIPPQSDRSPDESRALSSPTFSALARSSEPEIPNGRTLKRKAQNRAAQRAHRERQRMRVSDLHDKIGKLQERCKRLEARNQMLKALFQRFFRDGVTLLGTTQSRDAVGIDPCESSSDDEVGPDA